MKKLSRNLLVSIILLTVSGCSFNRNPEFLNIQRAELSKMQNDGDINFYAVKEVKAAEDYLIKAIKLWNSGDHEAARLLSEKADQAMAQARAKAEKEIALGLNHEEWEQRRWLQEVRQQKLKNSL